MDAPEPPRAGPSLRALVQDDGPLSPDSVRTLAVDLARSLSSLHLSGTTHGALSPDTVVLTPDGPALADATEPAPAYASPEQTRAHDLTPPADIFALGAVLTYAATGHPPFGEGSAELLAYRIAYHAPDLDGIPDNLRALITSCLAKSPADRPTATDVTLHTFTPGQRTTTAQRTDSRPAAAPAHSNAPEAASPGAVTDPRAVLLAQTAGSMRAVLTNSATMLAALRDRQAARTTPPTARPQTPTRWPAAEPTHPDEYRCVPSEYRNHPYSMTITTSTAGKQLLYLLLGLLIALVLCFTTPLGRTPVAYVALIPIGLLVGWRLAPKRDVLTVGPEGLHVRQRGRTSTRRKPTTFQIDWDDLKTLRVIPDKDAVRLVVTVTSPGRPNWFRDNNIRRFADGYELYRSPTANRQDTTAQATRLRQALTPFTESY
ncbi:serine/threonine protein kinase [Actinomadura harenae]|uniref:non-specific serine/threonine protein kinase n=1 Tax=Actinomadura harenae TaxID=2483351 RepID=A0A3M2LN92_9ACTN|nr:hypothetical protein [Actinomadura harenae]RMI38889.1 hypothetical protein EBO15_31430 [Actinomadura harenae]